MDVFVARHAIFDRNLGLFAYELLFRSSTQVAGSYDDTNCTLQVLANSLLSSGLQDLAGNAPLFINFGRELLTTDWTSMFPPSSVVIEILESVQPDPQVLASCVELRKRGYLLALDDVIGSPRDAMLAHLANFVKVDFCLTTREEQLRLAKAMKRAGKKLVAEKVETHEDFQFAVDAGYDLFQGFFFAKPTLLRGRQIPHSKMNGMRLLKELQAEDLDFPKLEQIIRCDVSLSFKLFRYVNSALFNRQTEISSIRQALLVLGDLGVRRFLTLATLPSLGAGSARELLTHALVRARFAEILSERVCPEEAQAAFLVGLFSLLDALVDRPLAEVLAEIALPATIQRPLMLHECDSAPAHLLRAVIAYEAADWSAVAAELALYSLPHQTISDGYLEAITWARETCEGMEFASERKRDALGSLGIERANMESLLALERALAADNTRVAPAVAPQLSSLH